MEETKQGFIYSINGPVIRAKGDAGFKMLEMVLVGKEKLIGEVIGLEADAAVIQVYEITTGLTPGEPVLSTGKPLSLQLAPGLIGNIFDGIERPLHNLQQESGPFISRGINVQAIDPNRKWDVHVTAVPGQKVKGGTIVAEVRETSLVLHKVMVPPGIEGVVTSAVPDGSYTIMDTLAVITLEAPHGASHSANHPGSVYNLTMLQEWPVRKPRPYAERLPVDRPLVTGQRVIDALFPIAKGGTAAIPGGFGTGKTMTQHQLAKWSDADIIVYIGCGERGNEMTEVLEDFPKLVDPKTGRPLMERTLLIANTSNMPVAAREASIYTGITLAEYFRDMGYDVAIMADSTSRWAEALREISGRLEEMPAEEGFPAYLPSRLSEFYERAGRMKNLNDTEGSVSIIGAISPQGGDFSEPVTQNTRRFVRCFWGLDRQLAYSRHYPAIHWLQSYSEYIVPMRSWYESNVGEHFMFYRTELMKLLQEESKLMEIVKLVGGDILPDEQKLVLETGRAIRLGFLQQNAYHQVDTFVPLSKVYSMMELILYLYQAVQEIIHMGIPISAVKETGLFEDIIKIKYTVGNDEPEKFEALKSKMDDSLKKLKENYDELEMRK